MMRISSTRVRRLANTYWPHGVAAVGLVCFLFYVASDGGAHVPPQIRAPPKLPKANTFAVQDSIFGFPRPGAPFGNCFGCVQKRPLKIRHRSYNPDKHTVYYGVSRPAGPTAVGAQHRSCCRLPALQLLLRQLLRQLLRWAPPPLLSARPFHINPRWPGSGDSSRACVWLGGWVQLAH